jgi:sec-independent protein translocase protein TatB
MFDIGWSELLLIGIVALIVVGPKELPGLFRTVGQFTGRARAMAREFQRSLEQAADESGLSEAAKSLNTHDKIGLKRGLGPGAPKAPPSSSMDPDASRGLQPDPGAPDAAEAAHPKETARAPSRADDFPGTPSS